MASNGLNKVIIIGNLGDKPDFKEYERGAICKLSVATSESWKDKSTGEEKKSTEWHKVTLFGNQASYAGKFLSKGDKVYVEGSLKTNKWEKDGITRYEKDIIARSIQILVSKTKKEGLGNNHNDESYHDKGSYIYSKGGNNGKTKDEGDAVVGVGLREFSDIDSSIPF